MYILYKYITKHTFGATLDQQSITKHTFGATRDAKSITKRMSGATLDHKIQQNIMPEQ